MATAAKTKMDVEKESESAEEGTKGDDNGADVSDFARRLRELFVEHKRMLPFSRVLLEKIMQTVCKEETETQLSSETRSEESARKNLEGILLDMEVSTTLKEQLEETRKDLDEKNTKLILAEEYLAIITQQQQEKLAGKDKEFKTINSRLKQKVAELEVTNSGLANEVENKDKELQTCYTRITQAEGRASKLEQDKNSLRTTVAGLTIKNSHLGDENISLKEQNDALNGRISQLNEDLDRIKEKFEAHENSLKVKNEDLKKESNDLTSQLRAITEQLHETQTRIVETENNCEKQLLNFKQTFDEKKEEMDEQRERLSEANKQLSEIQQTMDEKLQEADQEKTRLLEANSKQLSKLQQALDEKQKEVDGQQERLRETKNNFEKQMLNLKQALGEKEEVVVELQERLREVNKQQSELQQTMDEKLQEAGKEKTRLNEAKKQLSELHQTMDEKLQEADQEKTRLLQANSKQLSKLQQALEEKQKEVEGQKERMRKLEIDLKVKEDEYLKKLKGHEEDLTRIENECKRALSETAKEANERLERTALLESELTVMKDDHENEKIQVVHKMKEKAGKMIAKLETELSKNESDHEKVKEQLIRNGEEAQQRIAQLQTELSEKGSAFEKEKEQLIRKGDEAQQRISDLESKLTVMKEDHKNENMRLRNDMKEKLIEELESKLKVRKDEDHEKEKLQLQKEIERKDKLYDRLIQERDTLKAKVEYYTKRLALLSEKRVKQDQRKIEDTLGLNRQSELEKDINDFFDNERIDACELIQKKYGSEEENDILIYYPRLACMILETAYEQTVDARTAVVDLFEKISEWMIVHASEAGRLFDRVIKDGRYSSWAIRMDVPLGNKESEHPVDVDGLMLTLKETAHHANLDNFVQDVENIVYHKWMKWMTVEKSCGLTPSHTVLADLRVYTEACIRLTWRMVTQVPPMSLEYQSTILDKRHKQLGYHCSQEMCTTGDGPDEEIACYLWPGLFDGGGRLIRQGQVLCKVKQHP